jgi:hypothetical protein
VRRVPTRFPPPLPAVPPSRTLPISPRVDTTLLAALSYAAIPQRVFDVATTAGLAHAAPHWQVTAGVTVLPGCWNR